MSASQEICSYCCRSFSLKTNKLRHLALVHGVNEYGRQIDSKTLRRYKGYNRKKVHDYDMNSADDNLSDYDGEKKDDDDSEEDDDNVKSNFSLKMEKIMNSDIGENEKFRQYACVLNQYWHANNKNSDRFQTVNAIDGTPTNENSRKMGHIGTTVGRRRIRSRMRQPSWLPY